MQKVSTAKGSEQLAQTHNQGYQNPYVVVCKVRLALYAKVMSKSGGGMPSQISDMS